MESNIKKSCLFLMLATFFCCDPTLGQVGLDERDVQIPIYSCYNDRCDTAYNPDAPCQCNLYCVRYEDCCDDFHTCRDYINEAWYSQAFDLAGQPVPPPPSPLPHSTTTTTTTTTPPTHTTSQSSTPSPQSSPPPSNSTSLLSSSSNTTTTNNTEVTGEEQVEVTTLEITNTSTTTTTTTTNSAIISTTTTAATEHNLLRCAGRCGAPYLPNRPCQCNSLCSKYRNCCSDFSVACPDIIVITTRPTVKDNCSSLSDVIQEMWDNDVNAFNDTDVILDLQNSVMWDHRGDNATRNLFEYVNTAKLTSPTIATFLALLDNYEADETVTEDNSVDEVQEVDAFLTAVLDTKVMDIMMDYLVCKGRVSNETDLRNVLQKLWFDLYKRGGKSALNSTSGFEHYVGESKLRGSKVNGFHSWLSMFVKEREGSINYMGYVNRKEPNIIGVKLDWQGRYKPSASMFVKVSPELDVGIYTICFLFYPNKECRFNLEGEAVTVKTFSKEGHVATAFVIDR